MTSVLSKRQQARNEKALQDLVQSVPGNSTCADCQARNPSWASWNLGIFLCMRCAAIHRKLGTHVSKVKSLSMDSWSNEQVDNMRKVGNINSNKTYNPQAKKPPVPIDADEADSAMERYMRQKYINNAFSKSANSRTRGGSPESDDIPPPLPPKTPGRFGLGMRSASNIFPLSSKSKGPASPSVGTTHSNGSGYFDNQPTSPMPRAMSYPRPDSSGSAPALRNKSSQVFGVTVGSDSNNNDVSMDVKLAKLRDMGFTDDRRNIVVLKAVGLDVQRATEMLVRMGDAGVSNGRLSPHPLTSPRDSSLSAPTSGSGSTLTVPSAAQQAPKSPDTSDPFAMLDFQPPPAQPQSSQSTGTLQNKNPYNNQNPFGIVPTPQQQQSAQFNGQVAAQGASIVNLNQSFQNMSLNAPQALFPNHTGGAALSQQHQQQQQQQQAHHMQQQYLLLQQQQAQQQQQQQQQQQEQQQAQAHQAYQTQQQSATSSAAQNYFATLTNGQQSYQQQQQQQQQQYNPFMAQNGMAQQQPPPMTINTANPGSIYANNPFTRSPTNIQSPTLGQIPEQTQTNFFNQTPHAQTYPIPNGNPYAQQQQSQNPYGQQQQFYSQPTPTLAQQVNNPFAAQPAPQPVPQPRVDKASIMALYNMQQFAPAQAQQEQQQQLAQQQAQAQQQQQQQVSANNFFAQAPAAAPSLPASGSNPFLGMTSAAPAGVAAVGQRQPPPPPPAPSSGAAKATTDLFMGGRSRDSVMALGMEWSNGRHSPDAFASLSARH